MAIRELAPEVVAQIAAGEVITRAGDVVKELVENAIDAVLARSALRRTALAGSAVASVSVPGAGSGLDGQRQAEEIVHVGTLSVEIVDGGYTRIEIADDGCGIPPDELATALRRHATSKIQSAEDLERLASLGFRGEALAAIIAVADVTIVSATSAAEIGASIRADANGVGPAQPQARRPGTTVTVDSLFERIPARRKYQRTASAETAHIGSLLQGFSLAYPEISFALTCDGRRVLRTSGSGDLRETAGALFGPEIARELLLLRDPPDLDGKADAAVGLSGLMGGPSIHRATRSGIFLTINRRPVDHRALTYALEDGYMTQLPVGRHPVAIVDITIDPADVDANVHPTKREVRLLRDRQVFALLHRAVRATLMETIGMPRIGELGTDVATLMPQEPLDAAPVSLFSSDGASTIAPEEDFARPKLSSLRILGQVALTYIICEGRAGLYLVDQHAAHERVLLERLEENYSRQDRSQLLLDPVVVELPRLLRSAADEYAEALRRLGFDAEPFGDGEAIVRAVPSALRPRHIDRVLRETHEALDAEGARPDWRERLALLLSCKTAVKAGQHLEIAEMQSLLGQLDEANLCATCSHGRPTALLLSVSQLEREFGRR